VVATVDFRAVAESRTKGGSWRIIKRAIDLDVVKGKSPQVAQRRIARSAIVLPDK
jgi:hypothetical protein